MNLKRLSTRRILMSALGVIICGLSVGMFKHASLGVDPFQSLMSGLDAVIPIRFGTLYVIANLLLLAFALLFDRHKIGLATLINLFLLGYIAEFSQRCMARLLPGPTLFLRFVILAVAIVIMCLAAALYFTADLGVSPYDAVALIWSEKQRRVPFPICRVITDFVCVFGGALLCRAALESAALNVFVNTKMLADRAFAESVEAECDALLAEYGPRAEACAAKVMAHIRK